MYNKNDNRIFTKLNSPCCFISDNTPNLVHALRKKRPILYNNFENVILHQDNAPSHTAARTQLEIDVLGLQRAAHPPYAPDLAPLDFDLFPQFNRSLVSGWFGDMFQKWLKRHRKCIAHNGEYLEKSKRYVHDFEK